LTAESFGAAFRYCNDTDNGKSDVFVETALEL